MNLTFRFATRDDAAVIFRFIKELAEYERMTDIVTATETDLADAIFDKHAAEVLLVLEDDREVGFAIFFQNFSTFRAKSGIHLEDLFILPAYRGKGYGKATLQKLAQIAVERGCARFEWWCLDWNTPGINFYHSIGAEQKHDLVTFRLEGEKLLELAQGTPQ